jgi:hypothetical protein
MKRIVIGSILLVVFAFLGLIGSKTPAMLVLYEIFWAFIWGGMIRSGVKSLHKDEKF